MFILNSTGSQKKIYKNILFFKILYDEASMTTKCLFFVLLGSSPSGQAAAALGAGQPPLELVQPGASGGQANPTRTGHYCSVSNTLIPSLHACTVPKAVSVIHSAALSDGRVRFSYSVRRFFFSFCVRVLVRVCAARGGWREHLAPTPSGRDQAALERVE